jgi:flagellar operon protein (TIGR03826 family)
MSELSNCPNCNDVFVKTQFREVCQNCWKEEEKQYETVYQFIRKRENRAATIQQVEEQTGVEEELILKFIRSGRLQITHFPNLGYPCDKCGRIIRTSKLCETCTVELRKELLTHDAEEERKKQLNRKSTYFSAKDR